jgi:superfamily II helicase
MVACFISNPCVQWDDVLDWSCNLKSKSLQNTLCKLCLAAAVYHIWRLMNDLCYGNTPLTEEALVDRIKGEIRTRVMSNVMVARNLLIICSSNVVSVEGFGFI